VIHEIEIISQGKNHQSTSFFIQQVNQDNLKRFYIKIQLKA